MFSGDVMFHFSKEKYQSSVKITSDFLISYHYIRQNPKSVSYTLLPLVANFLNLGKAT